MSPILNIQRRYMQLGRVRLGEKKKTSKGKEYPAGRDTFRFTTASRDLAESVARIYGGEVSEWVDAPDEGYWQVSSEADALDIILPPVFSDHNGESTVPYSQWFELWSAAGCQRRCDGEREMLGDQRCICQPQVREHGEDARECEVKTRVSFMLPDVAGLGVWRLDSGGWNAAMELPGTLDLLVRASAVGSDIPAVLRIEHRTRKQPGEPDKKYVVPVIDLPAITLKQLAAGEQPLAMNAPRQSPPKPPLQIVEATPGGTPFEGDAVEIPFGEDPVIEPAMELDLEPKPASEPVNLGNELLDLCAQLDVELDDVRKAITANEGDEAWFVRQIARAKENIAMREATALAAEGGKLS